MRYLFTDVDDRPLDHRADAARNLSRGFVAWGGRHPRKFRSPVAAPADWCDQIIRNLAGKQP